MAGATTGLVSQVILRLPSGISKPSPEEFYDSEFGLRVLDLSEFFSTQADLDAAYGNGNYTLTVATMHDGTNTLTLPLPDDAFPNAPRLRDFEAAQAVNAQADFSLTWEPFTAARADGWVWAGIYSNTFARLFQSPWPWEPGASNGLTTSLLIPANTLGAGQIYFAELDFIKSVALDSTAYPGATGFALLVTRTAFPIRTQSMLSPRLCIFGPFTKGVFQVHVIGEPGRTLRLQASRDLVNWTTLVSANLLDDSFDYFDTESRNPIAAFIGPWPSRESKEFSQALGLGLP